MRQRHGVLLTDPAEQRDVALTHARTAGIRPPPPHAQPRAVAGGLVLALKRMRLHVPPTRDAREIPPPGSPTAPPVKVISAGRSDPPSRATGLGSIRPPQRFRPKRH